METFVALIPSYTFEPKITFMAQPLEEAFIPLPQERILQFFAAFKASVLKGQFLTVDFVWRVKESDGGIIPASNTFTNPGVLREIEVGGEQVLFSFGGAARLNPFPTEELEYARITVQTPDPTMPARKRDREADAASAGVQMVPAQAPLPQAPAASASPLALALANCHMLPQRQLTDEDRADLHLSNKVKFQVVPYFKIPQIRNPDFAVLDVYCFARFALEGAMTGPDLATTWQHAWTNLRVKKFAHKVSVAQSQLVDTHTAAIDEFLKELTAGAEVPHSKWKMVYMAAIALAAVTTVAITGDYRDLARVTSEGHRLLGHGFIDIAGLIEARPVLQAEDPKNGPPKFRGKPFGRGGQPSPASGQGDHSFRGRGRGRGY